MTQSLVGIGDFSRMTYLTVKALRYYHDVGLLEPPASTSRVATAAMTSRRCRSPR